MGEMCQVSKPSSSRLRAWGAREPRTRGQTEGDGAGPGGGKGDSGRCRDRDGGE